MDYPVPKKFIAIVIMLDLVIATGIIVYNEQDPIIQVDDDVCEEGRAYQLKGNSWSHFPILYRFTSQIDAVFERAIEAAMKEWETATGRDIFQRSSAAAQLVITREFSTYFQDTTLAYAGQDPYLTSYTGLHVVNFNPDKLFENIPFSCELREPTYEGPFDIMGVAVHELGHILGLAHTTDEFTTMHVYYIGSFQQTLSQGDIDGFFAIY